MNIQKVLFFGTYTNSLSKTQSQLIYIPLYATLALSCLTTLQFTFCFKVLPKKLMNNFNFVEG